MSSLPPKPRRKKVKRSSEESENLPSRKKKKKGSQPKKKKSASGNRGALIAKIGIPVGIVLLLASAFFFIDWGSMSSGSHEGYIKQQISLGKKRNALLKRVTNKATAEELIEKLKKAQTNLALSYVRSSHLRGTKPISFDAAKVLRNKYRKQQKEIVDTYAEERKRIMAQIPEAALVLENNNLLTTIGSNEAAQKLARELARKRARASGYSAVGASKALSKGDRVEVLTKNINWQDGTVIETSSSGRVVVQLDRSFGFGGRSSSSPEGYERKDIRIPKYPTPEPKNKRTLNR